MYIIKKIGLLVATSIFVIGYVNLFCVTLAISIILVPIEYFLTESIELTCDLFNYVHDSITKMIVE